MWLLFLAVAWVAAGLACAGVCRTAVAVAHAARPASGADDRRPPELTLYEIAYLAGGPQRLTDVALVSMARQRRLLLAHTGWASVVDPVGRDAVERAVLAAIGPDGQRRIPAIRVNLATDDTVRALSEGLVAAGLALPVPARNKVGSAIRRLRDALLLVLLTAGAAIWTTPAGTSSGPVLMWFAPPLVLACGTWAMARMEIHPYPDWATPEGERLLRRHLPADARTALTALAVHGRTALTDPALRTALHSSGA